MCTVVVWWCIPELWNRKCRRICQVYLKQSSETLINSFRTERGETRLTFQWCFLIPYLLGSHMICELCQFQQMSWVQTCCGRPWNCTCGDMVELFVPGRMPEEQFLPEFRSEHRFVQRDHQWTVSLHEIQSNNMRTFCFLLWSLFSDSEKTFPQCAWRSCEYHVECLILASGL